MTITQSRFVLPANLSVTCEECGFHTSDVILARNHDCEVQKNGGRCEDYPACGHEYGDCNGLLYGSDESIKEQVEILWNTGHGYCEHEAGIFNCDPNFDDDDEEEEVNPIDCGHGDRTMLADAGAFCDICGAYLLGPLDKDGFL